MFRCFFNIIDSTNTYAKQLITDKIVLPDVFSIISVNQSQSRGKLGSTWESSTGNIHLTISINLDKYLVDFKNIGLFSIVASLSVRETLEYFTFKTLGKVTYPFLSKWPNDIVIDNAKIAGILLEVEKNNQDKNYIIIGMGINLVTSPKIDKYKTASLNDIICKKIDISEFSNVLEDKFLHYIKDMESNKNNLLNRFKKNLYCFGEKIQIKLGDTIKIGIFEDITEEGYLILNEDGKKMIVTTGEVFGF